MVCRSPRLPPRSKVPGESSYGASPATTRGQDGPTGDTMPPGPVKARFGPDMHSIEPDKTPQPQDPHQSGMSSSYNLVYYGDAAGYRSEERRVGEEGRAPRHHDH